MRVSRLLGALYILGRRCSGYTPVRLRKKINDGHPSSPALDVRLMTALQVLQVWDLQRVPAFFSWHTGTHLSLIPSTDVRECCKRHRIYLARNIFAINNS